MQNLAQLGPKNCVCFFLCVFPFFFFCYFFFFFFLLIAWSKFLLILPIWAISQDFRFKNTTFSASDRVHPPQTPPVPCVQACNLRWRSTKSPPPLCQRRVYSRAALCSFGVLAAVIFFGQRVMEQSESLIAMLFFFLFLYINSRIFYLSLWRKKIKLITQFWRETIDL